MYGMAAENAVDARPRAGIAVSGARWCLGVLWDVMRGLFGGYERQNGQRDRFAKREARVFDQEKIRTVRNLTDAYCVVKQIEDGKRQERC